MGRLDGKPTATISPSVPGKYELYGLRENPFPSEPVVNRDSEDRRMNGRIYETALRDHEFEKIKANFLQQPQDDTNHLRIGYIMDESYIGRGNGKSAFLLHLSRVINKGYCLDLSNGVNKCFAIYLDPEPGGRTKSFNSFVDCFFRAILASHVVRDTLAILRLNAIRTLYGDREPLAGLDGEDDLVKCLCSAEELQRRDVDIALVGRELVRNPFLQGLPPSFPLLLEGRHESLFPVLVSEREFAGHYEALKRGRDRLEFVFTHLVRFFQAADFNGAYVLLDDFERIPDFQSARQKRDFALELRSVVFDGTYANARSGFFNVLLVLHAGVPRLISDAWQESGMETRSPISQTSSRHVIKFKKLDKDHVALLLQKYLSEYRINPGRESPTHPFTSASIARIGEVCEYNAAKILKTAYALLDRAAEQGTKEIDQHFVDAYRDVDQDLKGRDEPGVISTAVTADLEKKALDEEDT